MRRRYVEVQKGKSGYYWRLKAGNGQILAHSEVYSSRAKAVKTARIIFLELCSSTRFNWIFKEKV